MAEGIVSLSIRAWDGDEWLSGWDSDRQGLPMGVEILITATGAKPGEDPWDAPLVDLRTVVPIDRVPPPKITLKKSKSSLQKSSRRNRVVWNR